MHTINNPAQTTLFDPFSRVLTEKTREQLLSGWQGIFREAILKLMPVQKLAKHFSAAMGRPSKELYSAAGLLVMKEFQNWTKEQAVEAYSFRMDIHYALNLEPVAHDLSVRTLERYENFFLEDDLAAEIMHLVTLATVELCEVKVDQQRLDSTHLFSDMATFGRTRMMGVTIKRFLTQVRRHDPEGYAALAEALRVRYEPGEHRLFGDTGKDEESRRNLRQQVAEDMHALLRRFEGDAKHNRRSTFLMLVKVFGQQCEVAEEKVVVRAKTGGNVIQNPSDADATYDGHKGPGYQVQLAETCNPENEVQLITSALPQTAVESDTAALPAVLEDLEKQDLLPKVLLSDATYGSDENVQRAEAKGIEMVSPTKEGAQETGASDPYATLTVDDFAIDEQRETVACCPAGIAPESSVYDAAAGKTTTLMPASACGACEFRAECPVREVKGTYRLEHTPRQRRLAGRRREERTDAFRERYRKRGGIEGTNSGLKRRTGLGRLRVRGMPRIRQATLLRTTGWNILRAAASAKARAKVAALARKRLKTARFSHNRPGVRYHVPCIWLDPAALWRSTAPTTASSLRIAA